MQTLLLRPAHASKLQTLGAGARPLALPIDARPRLRPVTAADAQSMGAFLAGLAPGSRRQRFHGVVNPHSASLLRQLTVVDGHLHAAWVAVLPGVGGGEQVVGEARYVRDGADGAELAMTVADGWCGRGVSGALLAALTDHAKQAGVQQLWAEVQVSNSRMQAFLQRRGFGPTAGVGGVEAGVLHFARTLAEAPAQQNLPRRAWQACHTLWARLQPGRARWGQRVPHPAA
jgi:GNAT superfamily N-acetyltransferase